MSQAPGKVHLLQEAFQECSAWPLPSRNDDCVY